MNNLKNVDILELTKMMKLLNNLEKEIRLKSYGVMRLQEVSEKKYILGL